MEEQMDDANDSHDNNRHITIQALRRKTRIIISTLLNPIKVIPNEKGLPRDWQGLAELCGISGEKIPSIQQDSDPSNKVLDLWNEKDRNGSTIDNFLLYLEELDRFDVIEDIELLIEEDINFYKQNPNGFKCTPPDLDADKYILTIDDVSRISEGLEPQTYDAFVLFADDDIDFGHGAHRDHGETAIGIEQRKRKIIPCIYKPCDNLPPELSCYFMLDYRRSGVLWNFWEKLYGSIRAPKQKSSATKTVNSINRSFSQYNSSSKQCLLKSVLHHENATAPSLKPISQVKFSSMVDLNSVGNEKIIPDENLTSSTSANSLGAYSPAIKKRKSFKLYNRLKNIMKTKGSKNDEAKAETPQTADNVPDVEVEKEKKKTFFSRGSKRKKAAVAALS
ncbi:hypothetical protein NQ318_006791 [Aromia moschata]|uniref:Death domain-containing protein n=1 Tax=Aromia moschata TaxID=1265417 RepID=A0AAV8XSE7_9CUCU|nr:hypothetical protein NQ318_006791 [Aromia moschata]